MLCGLLLCGGIDKSQAFEKEGYNTPDTWKQQVSPGQFQESFTGIGLTAGTKLYTTLTSRYKLRFNDFANDQDFYQYLRVNTDPIKLGGGTLRLGAFARFAQDINGDNNKSGGDNNYYFFRYALDTQLRNDDWAPRLYQGSIALDGVIKNTNINAGRITLQHMNNFQLDGGDVKVKLHDTVSVYLFGGKPVSYYYNTNKDDLFGGGLTAKLTDRTKLGVEYVRLHARDVSNDYTKLRIDQAIPNGNIAVAYTMLDDAGTVNADVTYEIVSTGTILTARYEGLLEDIGGQNSFVVNPLTNILSTESRYSKYELGVYQAFLKHFAAGLSYVQRVVSGAENFDNRNYTRVRGKFDINGLPTENTYISLSADYWGIKSTATANSNDSIQYGVQINQKINKEIDVWAGTSYNRYDFDINPNLSTDKVREWARQYYVGSQYKAGKHLSFLADLNMDQTNSFDSISNDLNTNYKAEIWANIIF
jgi:hypothetical protein